MLEKLSEPNNKTISRPNAEVVEAIAALIKGNPQPVVGEIGVGFGATTLEIARTLNNRGQIHIFDFAEKCEPLTSDLRRHGFDNVKHYGNSRRHWDSYNWSLMKLVKNGTGPIFDFIYLDGAHMFERDVCAFMLCDKLLKVGGVIHFDDYHWTLKQSKWLPERDEFLTPEQIDTPQIKLVCDLIVSADPNYELVVPEKSWRKIR